MRPLWSLSRLQSLTSRSWLLSPVSEFPDFLSPLLNIVKWALVAVQSLVVHGVCLNANTQCCDGFYSIGFCPGPSNIRCCTSAQRCSDDSGWCNDLNHVSCSIAYVANLCPGPSNVRCCRGIGADSFCTPGGP
ncbi:hypothetical protein B0H13DRAFT_650119 [Mycena leptocephala]|nr:hypothetical protein B0H13DRAFT_650119 [Mycena leptocephala]